MTATLSKSRNSSLELLKLFAIVIIILSHVIQTLRSNPLFEFCQPIGSATDNARMIILSILKYGGNLGNTIFLLCSIYFLTDSIVVKKEKVVQFVLDVWLISVIIFLSVYCLKPGLITSKLFILKQFFPNSFANNWFVTCYLILYIIHPALNSIIQNLEQKTLSEIIIVLVFLYSGISFLYKGFLFFCSPIVVWTVIYLLFGYVKKYHSKVLVNVKLNGALVFIGLLGNAILVIATYFLGLHTPLFSHNDSLLRWDLPSNPFLLMSAFGLVNLAANVKTYHRGINSVASLSLFIYVIHENMVLRTYVRPQMWDFVYQKYGFQNLLLWVFLMTVAIFIISVVSSYLYKYTFHKFSVGVSKAIKFENE